MTERVDNINKWFLAHYKRYEQANADDLYNQLPNYMKDQVDIDTELYDEEEVGYIGEF